MAVVQNKSEALKKIRFFNGLDDADLGLLAKYCNDRSYGVGELCQIEGQQSSRIHFMLTGKVGAVAYIPNITFARSEIILDTLTVGEIFGWSSLIKGVPWSTLRVLEETSVLYIDAEDLINICESNYRIGYTLMKNLSMLIASRLKRNRISILNAIGLSV